MANVGFPKGKKNPKLSEVRKRLYREGKLERLIGEKNPMYGKSPNKGKPLWENRTHPFLGKKHSEETKEKIRLARLGKKLSKEHKRKIGKSITGEKNGMYGKTHTKRVKELLRKIRLNQKIPTKKTSIELKIFDALSREGINFIYQFKYKLGIADFLIKPNIIVECDGDYWHSLKENKDRDIKQTKYLIQNDYIVLRFSESIINKDLDGCMNNIKEVINDNFLL